MSRFDDDEDRGPMPFPFFIFGGIALYAVLILVGVHLFGAFFR